MNRHSVQDTPGEIFPSLAKPRGNHGFRPDRDDMLAILFAVGPQVKRGTRLPRMKSIDVAPMVARLLGLSYSPR